MRCWLESWPCHIFCNVWINISTVAIPFLTATSSRTINTAYFPGVARFLTFRASFISVTLVEAINPAVRGVYDGPFSNPSTCGTNIRTTSSSSLFNSSSLPESFYSGPSSPLEPYPSSWSISSTIRSTCFFEVSGSPLLVHTSAALCIVGYTFTYITIDGWCSSNFYGNGLIFLVFWSARHGYYTHSFFGNGLHLHYECHKMPYATYVVFNANYEYVVDISVKRRCLW